MFGGVNLGIIFIGFTLRGGNENSKPAINTRSKNSSVLSGGSSITNKKSGLGAACRSEFYLLATCRSCL